MLETSPRLAASGSHAHCSVWGFPWDQPKQLHHIPQTGKEMPFLREHRTQSKSQSGPGGWPRAPCLAQQEALFPEGGLPGW